MFKPLNKKNWGDREYFSSSSDEDDNWITVVKDEKNVKTKFNTGVITKITANYTYITDEKTKKVYKYFISKKKLTFKVNSRVKFNSVSNSNSKYAVINNIFPIS